MRTKAVSPNSYGTRCPGPRPGLRAVGLDGKGVRTRVRRSTPAAPLGPLLLAQGPTENGKRKRNPSPRIRRHSWEAWVLLALRSGTGPQRPRAGDPSGRTAEKVEAPTAPGPQATRSPAPAAPAPAPRRPGVGCCWCRARRLPGALPQDQRRGRRHPRSSLAGPRPVSCSGSNQWRPRRTGTRKGHAAPPLRPVGSAGGAALPQGPGHLIHSSACRSNLFRDRPVRALMSLWLYIY